ncbi:hypothetical protein FRB99_008703 [Tulasnella sp. 403]|nr:hypothetical protein FRB99_008703 [Tulasnella sp. 403]
MDAFQDANPGLNDPVPPPYELSQADYDRKTADVLQRTLPVPPSRSPLYTTWEDSNYRNGQSNQGALRTPSTEPADPYAQVPRTATSSHHRQNSLSGSSSSASHSSRHSKERPSWYNEAGLGGNSGSARHYPPNTQSLASRSSSQTTSPVDDTPPRIPQSRQNFARLVDEEAGIDNPPPPFAAATATPAITGLPPPLDLTPRHPTPTLYNSSQLSSPPFTSSSGHSPRFSIDSTSSSASAPHPHASDSPNSSTAEQPRYTVSPQRRDRRRSQSSFTSIFGRDPAGQGGQAQTPYRDPNAPQLAFDKSLAYSRANAYAAVPPPATNPSAFYNSAVASMLQSAPNASGSTVNYPSSTGQRSYGQPVSSASMYSQSSTSSQASTYDSQQQHRRPMSAQDNWGASYSTDSAAYYNTTSPPARSQPPVTYPSGPRQPIPARQNSQESLSRPSSRPPSSAGHRASYSVASGSVGYAASTVSSDEYSSTTSTAQKRQSATAFYAVGGQAIAGGPTNSNMPWVPPGAAPPVNLYQRRFA